MASAIGSDAGRWLLLLPCCLQSYGLNVARLARLPESVITRAKDKSEEFENAIEASKKDSDATFATAELLAAASAGSPATDAELDALVDRLCSLHS